MLKLASPGRSRRYAGVVVGLLFVTAVVGSVYAASSPSPQSAVNVAKAERYTLKMVVGIVGEASPRLHATTCLKNGQFYDLTETDMGKLPAWRGRFTVVPVETGQLEVQGIMSGGPMEKPAYPKLRMLPGQQGIIQIGNRSEDKGGKIITGDTIKIVLTPSVGC